MQICNMQRICMYANPCPFFFQFASFQRISVTLDFIFFLFIWFDLDGGKLTNVTRPSKIRFQFVTRCRPISALSVALFVQPLDDSVLDSLSLSLSLSSSLFIFECRTYFFFAAGRSVCPGRRFRLPPARLSSPRVGGDCGSFFRRWMSSSFFFVHHGVAS